MLLVGDTARALVPLSTQGSGSYLSASAVLQQRDSLPWLGRGVCVVQLHTDLRAFNVAAGLLSADHQRVLFSA
jgi:hypothetical protein